MPSLRSLFGWFQYMPMVIDLAKTILPPPSCLSESPEKTQEEIDDLRRDMLVRIDAVQNEHQRLRGRLRELENQLDTLRLIVWISVGTGAVLIVLLFLLVIALARR